jgi:hypothetical protein
MPGIYNQSQRIHSFIVTPQREPALCNRGEARFATFLSRLNN